MRSERCKYRSERRSEWYLCVVVQVLPRLSVVIVTRNRRDILRRCLKHYASQSLREIEFIVMDNGSNDGTDAMMREVYPEMTYRHLPENIGPLAFNKGAELASAPLLFRTDDDAYPEDTDTLERGVLFMEQRTNLAVLAGEIVDERTGVVFNWHPYAARYETIPEDGLDVGFFYGACAILRKGPFFEAGGFWDKFYLEEADLAARLIARDYEVKYVPWMRTIHVGAYDNKDHSARWLLMSEQVVRYQFRYFSSVRAFGRSLVSACSQLLLGVYHKLPVRVLFTGIQKMIHAARQANGHERVTLTSKQLLKVTLGESMIANTLRYYKGARKLRRKT